MSYSRNAPNEKTGEGHGSADWPLFKELPDELHKRWTLSLTERLLAQERRAMHVQDAWERRLLSETAAYQSLRAYCVQLEQVNVELDTQRVHLEGSLRCHIERCCVMSRELETEKAKNAALNYRLEEWLPAIDSLLKDMENSEGRPQSLTTKSEFHAASERWYDMVQELENKIGILQEEVYIRDDTIKDLRGKPYPTENSQNSDSDSDDSMEIVTGTSLTPLTE